MKRLLIGIVLCLLIIGGFVVFRKPAHAPAPQQSKETTTQTETETTLKPEPASFDKNKYSRDEATSIWVVVNKKRPLNPKDYAPNDLVAVGGGQQMRKEAATALGQLVAAAKTEGLTINPLSGYRSYNTQVSVYNNEVNTNGQAVADTQSARPGHSEHQTGLAIDVGGGGCGIEDCFGNTAPGKWVVANAYKYGFIIRYTPGKEAITGYRAEPWHLRYIGAELSGEMHKTGVTTLEEFFGLPAAPNYL